MLKKLDVLIRENSSVTEQQVINFLNNYFRHIEQDGNIEGYASVFDTRNSALYLYYSNKARRKYGLSKNKFVIADGKIITKNNFLSYIREFKQQIKEILLGNLKIITEKIRTNNGRAVLSEEPKGFASWVYVLTDEGMMLYDPVLDSTKELKDLPNDKNYDIIISYLTL